MSDAMDVLKALGAQFSPNFDAFASGEITVSQIQCLLCGKAPCECRPCPKCTWHGAPGRRCQACG
jgi:hypothetical protein